MKHVDAAFFDIDDTLYDHRLNGIPEKHLLALKKLQEAGTKVFLCTGRPMPLIEQLGIKDIFPFDGCVAGNGTWVYDAGWNILYDNPMDMEAVKQVFALAKEKNIPLFGGGKRMLVTINDENMQKMHAGMNIRDIPVRDLEPDDAFSVISLVDGNYDTPRPEFEAVEGLRVFYNRISTDINRVDNSKSKAARILLEKTGCRSFLAFGDALNDTDLLLAADYGVCMENGDPRVKTQVKYVCPSVHEGGIYDWLLENAFIQEEGQ